VHQPWKTRSISASVIFDDETRNDRAMTPRTVFIVTRCQVLRGLLGMTVAAQSAASTATAITAVTAKVIALRRPMAVRCPQSGHRATSWSKSMPQASHLCSSGCPVGSAVTTRKLANPISRSACFFSRHAPCESTPTSPGDFILRKKIGLPGLGRVALN
jgi:hypothetical protein